MWTKDGREIEDTGRFNFSQDGNSFTFEIPAALATDSGVYCTKATSSKGKAEWQFTLDVRVSSSPCADIDVLQQIKSMQVRGQGSQTCNLWFQGHWCIEINHFVITSIQNYEKDY